MIQDELSSLKELRVLLSPEDYQRILSLKKAESISREALCECGDIIISGLRRYCE